MEKRLGLLVNHIRRVTGNEDLTGVSDDEISRFLNDAQDRIQSIIVQNYKSTFLKRGYIDTVFDEFDYSLASITDLYMGTRIRSIDVNITNQREENYSLVKPISHEERSTVFGWYLEDGRLKFSRRLQKAQTNGIRITYTRKLKTLDIRRGQITSLAPLTVDTTTVRAGTDFEADYLTIVDRDGAQKVTEVINNGYTSGTGVISTTTDVTAAAVGDWVIYGKNSTTHSELDDTLERYLLEYGIARTVARDSSTDLAFSASFTQAVELELEGLYSQAHDGGDEIPVTDPETMIY